MSRPRRGSPLLWPLWPLAWAALAGCSSAPPPAPAPPSVLEARRSAADAARFMDTGQWQAAADEWRKASGLYALLNDLPGRAVALHNEGQARRRLGQTNEAAAALEEAAQLNQSLGRPSEWWRNQLALLQLESSLGQTQRVDQRFAALEPKLNALGDAQLRAVYLNEAGLRHIAQREWDPAEVALGQARAGFEKAGDRSGLAAATGNQARLMELRDKPGAALELWRSALGIYQALGDTQGIAQTLESQGRVLLAMPGRLPEAEELLRRALRNYKLLNQPAAAERAGALLARALEGQGKRDEPSGKPPAATGGAAP